MFIDKVKKVYFKSGNGGKGCVGFRREKFIPMGGPDGGSGGRGGHIILRGSRHANTLVDFQYKKHFKGEKGQNGKGSSMDGKNGKDLIVLVPLGTEILHNNEVILEILEEKEFIFLKGGKGGIGNKKLATSTNKAPKYAIDPKEGKEIIVDMKLKLIGDIGIIGVPNAGKSSFINSITNANSKVANYKFTTLFPHLGSYKGKIIFVDIPGLIEGASEGKGLGYDFLSHIERCKYLLLIVDIADNPEKDIKIIENELKTYGIKKEIKLCFNKCDLVPEDVINIFKNKYKEAFFISINNKINVEKVAEYFLE